MQKSLFRGRNTMMLFWERLGKFARVTLVVGTVLILIATAMLAYWLLHGEKQVLFADLTPTDTLTMTGELDRLKIAYTLSDEGSAGTTILVDKNEVYKTRIKLMGKDIPLHGAVGFELFNNGDFGMTEFAQKITYQRALQGELTRTILSLDEIRDARVLLALPEQGLFRQGSLHPTASVTLTLKQNQRLAPEQVAGIQHLVAAAVPGIKAQDVTLVDQRGVALTRGAGDADGGAASNRLDLKKDTEKYLANKATQVLERALGPGQALASVDVSLSMDRIETNTDEVVGAPSKEDVEPTGVVVRSRDSSRDSGSPMSAQSSDASVAGQGGGSTQREVEYAVGHRIEQVVTQPGAIRRIDVAVVVKAALNPDQQERIRKMVAASVGASAQRGDSIVVQTLEDLRSSVADTGKVADPDVVSPPVTPVVAPAHESGPRDTSATWPGLTAYLRIAAGLLAAVLLGFLSWRLLARSNEKRHASSPRLLSKHQREQALLQLRHWMQNEPPSTGQSDVGLKGRAP
ncbi:flagellar basal-body MS-ring/collar protein FliF [Herbaspirillum rubrisubalbicans]|uniref:flagellar basal-body MS-ring/collar protein FliF n=1 Tax=Herbaspirillum rubrisubalbicans TaxID=80842 RepID=UPI00215EF646|nr:flagellar basal-body MS-ring/collar protein FliF [Herbaspirillum rubrisubalbicans]